MIRILDLKPNTEEWLAVRKSYFCASEAQAMMGASQYMNRQQLLRIKKGLEESPPVSSGGGI